MSSLSRPLSKLSLRRRPWVHNRCLRRIGERAMRILAAEQHQPTLVRIECHRMLDTRGRSNFLQLLPFAASPLPGVSVHRSVDCGPAVQKQRRASRGHLGRGQPRLTCETLQAAYSQPTFRNPLWDHKIRKRLRRPISRRSISSSATVCPPQDGSTAVASKPKCSVLAPGDCGESGCRGREKVRHD